MGVDDHETEAVAGVTGAGQKPVCPDPAEGWRRALQQVVSKNGSTSHGEAGGGQATLPTFPAPVLPS